MNWKRIALLVGFIVVVIIIGYGLYALFLRPSLPTPPTNRPTNQTNTNQPGGQLPTPATNGGVQGNFNTGTLPPSGRVTDTALRPVAGTEPVTVSDIARGGLTRTTALTTGPVNGATLSANGRALQYYDRATGIFYTIDQNGNATRLSDKQFFEVETVTWSPTGNQAILEYPDGANISYNFDTEKQITLPQHWEDFEYDPSGNQLIFKSLGDNAENRWLAISRNDGSQARKLEHLGNNGDNVHPLWSANNQVAAIYTEPENANQQNLYFVGLNGENFKSATVDGYDLQAAWSPTGNKLLYSAYNAKSGLKPNLWISANRGGNIAATRRDLKIQTWADKCTFATDTEIYCAVPRVLPSGAGIFAEDFQNIPSDIYKINLENGFKSLVAIPDKDQSIESVFVSEDKRYLYFIDQQTKQLHQIKLQ